MQELRPKAQEWVLSLDRLRARLKACSNPFHKYYEGLGRCPLCEVESKTGIVLFNYTGVIAGSQRIFNITAILKEIRSVQGPGELPPIPSKASVKLGPTKEYLAYRNKRNTKRILSFITATAGIAVICVTGLESAGALFLMIAALTAAGFIATSGRNVSQEMLKKAIVAFNDADRQLDIYKSEWYSTASDKRFNNMKSELLKLADKYNELTAKGQKMVSDAEANIRKYQLQKFLDSFRIYDAKIEKINHTRKATLQSYGIETAADIDPRYLVLIPGFGPKYANNLLEWRKKIESRFVFNPNKGVDRFQLAEIHKKINEEKLKLENELSKGAAQLKHIAEETKNIRNELMQKIEKVLQEYTQAEANLKCCGKSKR
jgi:DNA-binding helix-hairpin-helix protein with protein kinase domain